MDFRCFLVKGDEIERLSDGFVFEITEVRANEVDGHKYLWSSGKHINCTLKEGEFVLVRRKHDSRCDNY